MLEERAAQWKDEYIRQGVILGEARGEARGRAEGEARGIGVALNILLAARFGNVPQHVISALAAISDTNVLKELTSFASKAESLQAFVEQMEEVSPTPVQ